MGGERLPIKVSGDPCTGLAHRHFQRCWGRCRYSAGFMHQYPSLLATFIIHFPYVLDLIYSSLRLHLCKRYQHHIALCARHPTSRAETVFCALTRRVRYQSLKVPFARAAPSAPLFSLPAFCHYCIPLSPINCALSPCLYSIHAGKDYSLQFIAGHILPSPPLHPCRP